MSNKSVTPATRMEPLHWSTDEVPSPFVIITKGEGFPTEVPKPCDAIGTHPPHIDGGGFCPGMSIAGIPRTVIIQDWASAEEAELRLNGDPSAAVVLVTPSDPDNDASYRKWISVDRVSGLNGRPAPAEGASEDKG